jgi:hypothetical protein
MRVTAFATAQPSGAVRPRHVPILQLEPDLGEHLRWDLGPMATGKGTNTSTALNRDWPARLASTWGSGVVGRKARVTVSHPAPHWLRGVLGNVDTTDAISRRRPSGTQVPGMSASSAWRYADDPGKVVVAQP